MTSIPRYSFNQLEGGGRVVSEKLPAVRSISLGFWIGAGSRYEEPAENGISHFIEHLLFKGSESYDALEIAQIFDSFGGELNAATAHEYTVVYARFLDAHLKDAFEVMANMVIHPLFAEVDPEREVVVEEIAMYEDSPGDLVSDYLNEAVFGAHPLGQSVIGTSEIITGVTVEQLGRYHAGHYTLPNMVVAAAGNVDQEELVELAASSLAMGNGAAPLHLGRPAPDVPDKVVHGGCFYEKDTQQYHVCIGGLGLPRHAEERFTLSILNSILGSSASSRLFQEVREKRGLVYSVYSYSAMYSDTGMVGIYFGCRKDSVCEVTEIIVGQLESLMNEEVSAAELERAKESAKGRVVLGMETTSSRMTRLGKLTVTGADILSLDQIIERIDRVSAADIMAMARRLYEPEQLTAVAIGPDADVFDQALKLLKGERQLMVKKG